MVDTIKSVEFAYLTQVETANPDVFSTLILPGGIRGIVMNRLHIPLDNKNSTAYVTEFDVMVLINIEKKTYVINRINYSQKSYGEQFETILKQKKWTQDDMGCTCCPDKDSCKSYIKKRVVKEAAAMACVSTLLQRSNAKNNMAKNALEFVRVAYNAELISLRKYWADVWEYDILKMREKGGKNGKN